MPDGEDPEVLAMQPACRDPSIDTRPRHTDAQNLSMLDDAVLPPSVEARLGVELGVSQGWERYVGARGDMMGVERFGASAPAEVLLKAYGFTADAVYARAKALLAR